MCVSRFIAVDVVAVVVIVIESAPTFHNKRRKKMFKEELKIKIKDTEEWKVQKKIEEEQEGELNEIIKIIIF